MFKDSNIRSSKDSVNTWNKSYASSRSVISGRSTKGPELSQQVKEYLEGRGFILRHLEPFSQEHCDGEAVECNAFFTRRSRLLTPKKCSLIGLWEQICNLPGRPS